ncbi:Selenium metabolism protein YedF, partial [Dysosmobacter welbionis]
GNRLLFVQIPGQLVQLLPVLREDSVGLFVLALHQLHHLPVDLRRSLGGAGQGGVAPQVLILHCLQGHHVKVRAHAVPGNHGPGQLGGLLDVIGGAGGGGVEDQLFRR